MYNLNFIFVLIIVSMFIYLNFFNFLPFYWAFVFGGMGIYTMVYTVKNLLK